MGQPMFRTLLWFCLYSSKVEYFGGAERFKTGCIMLKRHRHYYLLCFFCKGCKGDKLDDFSTLLWHNYFPLYIKLHVRNHNRWVLSSQIFAWKMGSLDIRPNSGKQHLQFSQNSFSFCVWHCIWQAVRIQMKSRIRCGSSSGSTLSAKTKCGQLLFHIKRTTIKAWMGLNFSKIPSHIIK